MVDTIQPDTHGHADKYRASQRTDAHVLSLRQLAIQGLASWESLDSIGSQLVLHDDDEEGVRSR